MAIGLHLCTLCFNNLSCIYALMEENIIIILGGNRLHVNPECKGKSCTHNIIICVIIQYDNLNHVLTRYPSSDDG